MFLFSFFVQSDSLFQVSTSLSWFSVLSIDVFCIADIFSLSPLFFSSVSFRCLEEFFFYIIMFFVFPTSLRYVSGQGVCLYDDGNRYECEWRNDVMTGMKFQSSPFLSI